MEKYLINFDELQIGDKVWHFKYGWMDFLGNQDDKTYPFVFSKYGDKNDRLSFSKKGKSFVYDANPSIFKSNPFDDIWEPRVMKVSQEDTDYKTTLIIAKYNNFYYSYNGAIYGYAEEIQTITLTKQQIADKFGIDIKELIIE